MWLNKKTDINTRYKKDEKRTDHLKQTDNIWDLKYNEPQPKTS